MAAIIPAAIAVAEPVRRGLGKARYRTITFADLEADVNRIASGLLTSGFRPGMRIALLVRPGIEFISLVFALLRRE